MSNKLEGTVKFFNDIKGFGFIKPKNGERDVFVHSTQLSNVGGTLKEDQDVVFETIQGRKGLEAINVEWA